MPDSTSYGEAFGKRLSAQSSSYATRALRNSTIAVTELRYDTPQFMLSTPPIAEDAFVLALHLKLYRKYEYFENDRPAPVSTLLPGHSIIYDIKRKPIFHLNDPFHSIHFYFPRSALNALADEADAPRFEDLRYRPGQCMDDSTIRRLAATIQPYFAAPDHAPRLFMDHVMLAAGHHVAITYGGMELKAMKAPGGLARWQEDRAKEMLAANLVADLPLATLATECGLSVRHFTRAFRQTTGLTPHQWLTRKRVETAQLLLRDARLKLTDVASACGFADQSHFTRVFAAQCGVTPGVWRRGALK